jgi:hypothetical protein
MINKGASPLLGQLDDVFVIWITKEVAQNLVDEKVRRACHRSVAAGGSSRSSHYYWRRGSIGHVDNAFSHTDRPEECRS